MSLDRRQLLAASAAPLLMHSTLRGARGSGPDPIERLAAKLIDTPRAEILPAIEPLLREGLTWRDLLAAVFHAGILEVQPRPVGFKLHAVMVVESVFQLAEAGREREAWLAVLWNADDFKRSQARDEREGGWRLPPAPVPIGPSDRDAEAIAVELDEALASQDAERANSAIVAAARGLDRSRIFEVLWPYTLRDFTNLGHKPIFGSHVERVLARLGGARAEPALRSLVWGLLDGAPGVHVEEYRASVEAALGLPETWAAGRADPARSLSLAHALRPATSAEARALVLEALTDGLAPSAVWDALRLVAADLFARRPSLLPVHPTTVTSALYYISRTTASELTRRVALLQAAAWLPLFRTALGISVEDPGGIDPLVDEADLEAPSLAEVFEDPGSSRTRAWLESSDDAATRFETQLRTTLLERGAREHHELKYAAAILEDVRTADPRWRPALLSSSLAYLPNARSDRAAITAAAVELLERIRVR